MRRPLVHFLLLGTLLFASRALLDRPSPAAPGRSADALLLQQALEEGLHRHDPVVQRRLAANMRFARADPGQSDAVLASEAIALGMHESDPVVRRRLVQAMKLRIEHAVRAGRLSEEELERHLHENASRFTEPARVRIRQEPLDGPLPLPAELPSYSQSELARLLGEGFARAVFASATGAWTGPVESTYGRHRVWIHERVPAARSQLASVRSQVREDLLNERAGVALAREVARLRERDAVSLGPPPRPSRPSPPGAR